VGSSTARPRLPRRYPWLPASAPSATPARSANAGPSSTGTVNRVTTNTSGAPRGRLPACQDGALPYRGGTQPMPEPFRRRVEQRSAGVLARVSRLPGWLPLVLVVGLTAGGLLVRGPAGAALLAVLALLLAWLAYLGWPALSPTARLARMVVLVLVVAAA